MIKMGGNHVTQQQSNDRDQTSNVTATTWL